MRARLARLTTAWMIPISLAWLAGCSRSGGGGAEEAIIPAPACRTPSDCTSSGMPHASCVNERCKYTAALRGRVKDEFGRPAAGDLHMVVYEANAIGLSGPRCDARIYGTTLNVATPALPYDFEIGSLPSDGEFDAYAFIDVGNDTASELRAGRSDIEGHTPFSMFGGQAYLPAQYPTDAPFEIIVGADVYSDPPSCP